MDQPANSRSHERSSFGKLISPEYLHRAVTTPGRLQNTYPQPPRVGAPSQQEYTVASRAPKAP